MNANSLISAQISDAINNNISINQTFPSQSEYKTFIQQNLFYYQNYPDPNNSNFTNIPNNAIKTNSLYQYEINVEQLNGSIFYNGKKITNNLIFNFIQPQATIWTPLIVILIVIIALALLIGIIILIWWLKQHTKKIKVEDWRY